MPGTRHYFKYLVDCFPYCSRKLDRSIGQNHRHRSCFFISTFNVMYFLLIKYTVNEIFSRSMLFSLKHVKSFSTLALSHYLAYLVNLLLKSTCYFSEFPLGIFASHSHTHTHRTVNCANSALSMSHK